MMISWTYILKTETVTSEDLKVGSTQTYALTTSSFTNIWDIDLKPSTLVKSMSINTCTNFRVDSLKIV